MLHPAEAETVCWLYDSYLAGPATSLGRQAPGEGIPYDGDKPWNKNMAARILADSRYTGEGGFRPSSRRPGSTWFRLKGKENALQKDAGPEGTAETVRQPTGMGGAAGVGPPEPTDPASGAYTCPAPVARSPLSEVDKIAPRTGRAPAPPAGG